MAEVTTPIKSLKRSSPDDEDALSDGDQSDSVLSSPLSTPMKPADLDQLLPTPSILQLDGNVESKSSAGGQGPSKKRKLTTAEKEQRQAEKEAKQKAREEQRSQRAEEKRLKEEEKRKKDEEREEKRREKELALQQKEEEKLKKEEEKLKEKEKKERSQMRLNSFFVKTSIPAKPIAKQELSEYERYFPPFELPSHSALAPYNLWAKDSKSVNQATQRLDKMLNDDCHSLTREDMLLTVALPGEKLIQRGVIDPPVRGLIGQLHGSAQKPIDLTNESEPLSQLRDIPMKYIHFGEDVRPPYFGTFTKPILRKQVRKLGRSPYQRALPEINYEYDSEAEWEEPEEGEDLNSDGDEDSEEEGDDDMEGFLDDEDETDVKRRQLTGDMEPVSTGLCWENDHGAMKISHDSDVLVTNMRQFKMQFLLEPNPKTIDPYSTSYWHEPEPVAKASANNLMKPPRLPLAARSNLSAAVNNGNVEPQQKTNKEFGPMTLQARAAKAAKRLVPSDIMQNFKDAINGSDLTKIALIESLKKQFPKVTKDAILNTLDLIASREGATRDGKRWTLKDTSTSS